MNDLDHPQLIFESTGIYSRGMERFCCVNQINYIQMNPLEAKFKTSALRSWKTDQADAHKLACLGPTLKQTDSLPIHELIFFELRERVRFHLEIENEQNRLKFQILELLHQTFPGLERLFSSRYSIIALNIAEIFTHPDMVLDIDKEVLITHIFNSTDKGMSMDKATKYALQLRVIAQESYPNVDRHSFLVEKLRLLIQQLKQSIHHLKQLDDAMIQLAQQLNYFKNIHSIPGIDINQVIHTLKIPSTSVIIKSKIYQTYLYNSLTTSSINLSPRFLIIFIKLSYFSSIISISIVSIVLLSG